MPSGARGLHKHLLLLSLALEMAKEGRGQWTQQREGAPASAPRLPRAWCLSRCQGPQGPEGDGFGPPAALSSLKSSLPLPLQSGGERPPPGTSASSLLTVGSVG